MRLTQHLCPLALALAGHFPHAVAADVPSAAPTARTVVPEGAYYVGRVQFTTPGKQNLDLLVNFRGGKGVSSILFVDGKYYSPSISGMTPSVDLCRVSTLQCDGQTMSGDFTWQPPKGAAETIPLKGTIAAGKVTGQAGSAGLTGTLSNAAQMQTTNGFSPGRDWTTWTGSKGDWTGADSERALVADPKDARLAWFSETTFGAGREARGNPMYYISGYASPILGEGRVFTVHQEPVGELVDTQVAAEMDTIIAKITGDLDPLAVATRERGGKYMARVEAEDVAIAIDTASGATLWKTTLPVPSFMPAPYNKHADDNRTGCYMDGKFFVLGRTCVLYCLEGSTGKLRWQTPVPKTHEAWEKRRQAGIAAKKMVGMNKTYYPSLHHADGVIFGSFPEIGVVVVDAANGKVLWQRPSSSPAAAWEHDGRRDIVFMTDKGLTCVEARTGTVIWEKPIEGSPTGSLELCLVGSHLITRNAIRFRGPDGQWASQPQGTFGYLLEKDGPRKLWMITDEEKYYAVPMHATAARNGVVYLRYTSATNCQTPQKVIAVELATGTIISQAKFTGVWIGMTQVANGWVLVHEDGCHCGSDFAVYTERDLKKIGMFKPTHNTTSSYDSPMAYPFVDGRLILRGDNRIYCYDLRAAAK